MLKYLSIKNLILIQHIEIDFQNGLSVFTGETGAGKSMILDSLSLISGGRTKSSIKPEKGKKTIITAIIDIQHLPEIKMKLDKIPSQKISCSRVFNEIKYRPKIKIKNYLVKKI